MDSKRIHISELFLDSENPRHDPIKSQKRIIEQLLKEEKIENLAKDIARQKSLSPLEVVGVMPLDDGNGEYIVLEGNRRVCACMLLNNPNLSPDNQTRQRLEKLKESNDIPDTIDCIVFDSRDDADHWIQLRHEGQQDGIGTKSWDAPQTARYAEKRGRRNKNIQSQKLLDYAVDNEIISKGDSEKIKITTLQRFLGNPVFRNALGLENNYELKSRHPKEIFDKFVDRFLEDALLGKSGPVKSRTNAVDWADYANKLQQEIAPPPTSTEPVTDFGEPNTENRLSEKPKNRSKQDPAKRKYLLDRRMFSIEDKTLNRVYIQMKRLEIDGFEFCIAFLIRAFLERTVILYLDKYSNGNHEKKKLHAKLKLVSDDLASKGISDKKLKQLRIASSNADSWLSPETIGSMVHLATLPTKRDLINTWDSLEPGLKIVLDSLQ